VGKKIRYIFLLVGLAFFCYLVWSFGIDNILANIGKTGWWFVPIVAIWGCGYIFNALSLKIIIGETGGTIRYPEIYRITLSSFALNYITPFMTLGGEPFRALALKDRIGTPRAVSSVFLFRIIHTIAHIMFWLIMVAMIIIWFPLSTTLRLYLGAIFVVLLGLISFLFIAHKSGIFEKIFRLVLKIPLTRTLAPRLIEREQAIRDIDEKIQELYNVRPRAFFQAVACELASRFINALEFYFILHAVGHAITILHAFYISAALSLLLNILFFIPFELGAREGSLYVVMQSLDLTPGIGIYVSIVNRIREMFWVLIGLALIQFSNRRAQPEKPAPSVMQTQL
jgi:uncharacterized protein (TIRG00374 family)